ncbi:DUF2232 domain-containing protein [Candidatus Palauibacter sp.]|uniref:DUF2232 domain-containing protein n=1 Tax=Candidatus Palauibacter sp. TaxID=3101350 RepID=UPI003AF2E885
MILLSPLNSSPLGLMAIVGVPTAVAILAFEPPQTGTAVLALLLLAGAAAGFGEATPLWYIERGWAVLLAGGFAISTTLAPGRPILDRSLMGVAIAGGTVGAMGAQRPDLPAALDRHVSGQFDRVLAMYDSRAFGGPVVDAAVRQFVGLWEAVYPAMLVLASVSALALCVYLLGRIRGEEAALPPLRHFRFSTHLVWVLILGLALLVLPAGDWAHRAGGNVVTVMGGLYLLRGAAVLVWVGAAVISSGWVIAVWAIAALALYPVTIGTALVVGVSDTWLDLRSRLGVETGEK